MLLFIEKVAFKEILYRKDKYFEFKGYFMVLLSKQERLFLQGNLNEISNSYRYELSSLL